MAALAPGFWEDRFQDGKTPWERGQLHPAFLDWRARVQLAPCRILVPGAGRSPEPEALAQAGFDITTLDLADSAVAFQTERLGPGRVVQADVTIWRPDTPFDAVYDQTCLCALPPDLWPAYQASLRRWIRPGGRLFILFMQSQRETAPPFDCPLPHMRTLFGAWSWPETLGEPLPHGLGTLEVPAILQRPHAFADE